MPKKTYLLDDGTEINVYKSRLSRNLRISLTAHGKVRVSIPSWAPYKAGVEFAKAKHDWIADNLTRPSLLYDGQVIGKSQSLTLVAGDVSAGKSRIYDDEVRVTYPSSLNASSDEVQTTAKKAAIRGIRAQAQAALPIRLDELSNQTGLSYKSCSVRVLKGRWGSCDSNSHITLNIYLMKLPWQLIDYVLIHELTHTAVMKHGPEFWAEMEKYVDNPKDLKKQLRQFQPTIG